MVEREDLVGPRGLIGKGAALCGRHGVLVQVQRGLDANHGLGLTTMLRGWFLSCSKCSTLIQQVNASCMSCSSLE